MFINKQVFFCLSLLTLLELINVSNLVSMILCGMLKAVNRSDKHHCYHCFKLKWPLIIKAVSARQAYIFRDFFPCFNSLKTSNMRLL